MTGRPVLSAWAARSARTRSGRRRHEPLAHDSGERSVGPSEQVPLGLNIPCHGWDAENMETKQAISAGQAAKRLGISVRTPYRWEADGRLHALARLPIRQRRFAAREVDAFLGARTGSHGAVCGYARVSSEKQAEAGTWNGRGSASWRQPQPRDMGWPVWSRSGLPVSTRSAVACGACSAWPPRVNRRRADRVQGSPGALRLCLSGRGAALALDPGRGPGWSGGGGRNPGAGGRHAGARDLLCGPLSGIW